MSCYRTFQASSKWFCKNSNKYVRFMNTSTALDQHVTSNQTVQSPPIETIIIPKRKKRSPTAILEALSPTVGKDHTAAAYRYHDDPYLIPTDSFNKKNFSLAKAAGKKAARYLVNRYSKFVKEMYDFAEPKIEAYQVKTHQYTETEGTEEALVERIMRNDVPEAIKCYKAVESKGVELSQDCLEKLLELLCVFNCEPVPVEFEREEAWYRQDVDPQARSRPQWKKGLAEEVFENLPQKTSSAYCSLIRSYCKYNNLDEAWNLYSEAKDKNLTVSLNTCDAVLKICAFFSDSPDNKWHRMLTVLQDIKSSGFSPDLGTFNAVLFSLSRLTRYRKSQELALRTLSEMKEFGIEPSLASFSYILRVIYDTDDVQGPILGEIVNYLEGRQLTLQDPADFDFFPLAMQKCYHNLQDLELAYKIDALLNAGENIKFIGDSAKEMSYYSCFFRVVCLLDSWENIMKLYHQVLPNIWTPTLGALEELFKAMELHEGYEDLPLIWSDLVLFRYNRNFTILKQFISLMAKKKHEPGLQGQLSMVAKSIKDSWLLDQEADFRNPMQLTGELVSHLIIVSLRAGDLDQAWDLLELAEKQSRKIGGLISSDALTSLVDSCLEHGEVDKAIKCVTHLNDQGASETQQVVEKLKNLQLTESQINQVDSL